MKIVETNLKFKSNLAKLDPKAVRYLVVHHSVSGEVSASTIHQWHLNQGWAGIGYHYVVRANGTTERGRPETYQGAHAKPVNSQSIGVCCTGDFTKHAMPEAQKKALVGLLQSLKQKYDMAAVVRHKDVDATACPGNIPFSEIRNAVLLGPNEVKLIVNGKQTDIPVRLADGRTEVQLSGHWVQVRELANLLGATLTWDAESKTAVLMIK
jgi:hypothetical protein